MKLDEDSRIVVPTDNDLSLENQDTAVLEDSLDMVDQEGTDIMIDRVQTQEFLNLLQNIRNLCKHFLVALYVHVAHTIKSRLTAKR